MASATHEAAPNARRHYGEPKLLPSRIDVTAPGRTRTHDTRYRNKREHVLLSRFWSQLTYSPALFISSSLVQDHALAHGRWTTFLPPIPGQLLDEQALLGALEWAVTGDARARRSLVARSLG